jgi:glycine/D-amino acid oxidase-like deaminating enzyme
MISIWEKQSFLESDVAIIGAGITGLSAAASIKERFPRLKVIVLEKGVLPSGASTKNAGFACFGSLTELLEDLETLGENGMQELVEMRWKGLEKTRERLGADTIDLKVRGGYELIFDETNFSESLHLINALIAPIFKQPVFSFTNDKIAEFGFAGTSQLIWNRLEGQLDTGKLLSSLWDYCTQLGIRIHTGIEVTAIEEGTSSMELKTDSLSFQTKKVAICTNAFSNNLLEKQEDILPGRGMVLSIKPEKPVKFSGTFHYDTGYFYFRDYYDRILFGGGRNLDMENEQTTHQGINQKIKNRLIEDLNSILIPDQDFNIEMEWSGTMAFGVNKKPIIKNISPHVVLGARLGGMGVAIGSLVGEELCKCLLNQ